MGVKASCSSKWSMPTRGSLSRVILKGESYEQTETSFRMRVIMVAVVYYAIVVVVVIMQRGGSPRGMVDLLRESDVLNGGEIWRMAS
jgi:hypothetical protein